MSKKVVTKKAQAPPTENGTSAAASDVRVAHQLRVLETVAAGEDEKKYSPRTEGHIQRLTDVLDFYEYSRADIAGLVRRCHHDENQIQIAVANIIEDRANHEKEEWGTVKNKKQAKEERKIKEEEEKKEQKKEQERLQKEEKQRREAERKAAKEAERGRRGKGGKNGEDPAASLPPDPAILFAGTKPTSEKETSEKWDGQWWESSGDKWNGKSWEWQESWHGEEWSSKAQSDNWWGGQWEKAGSRKKGYKEKKDAPPVQEEEEAEGDFWDMPDSAQPAEGGLDQWTLGRLPGHERENDLVPKAMPDNALTVEALERGHLAAPSIAPTAPPSGKPMEMQPDLLAALGAPVASSGPEERAERGEREKGRGKGKKGKERDKEAEKERLERIDRSDDPRRQAVEQVGEVVTVRKHSSMGCAVVSMTDVRVRQAIVAEGNECTINGIKVQIKPHTNKETKEEVLTDLFVAWGRQVEKVNPLSEEKIAKYFDTKYKEIAAGWKALEDERREAEEREKVRAQEQQRQELVLRQRTEERRRYEQEEEQKRRQHEAEQQQKWMSQQWMQQGGTLPQAGARMGTEQFAQLQQQPQAVQWNNSQQWMQAAMYQAQAAQAQGWQMAQRMQGMSGQAQQENPDWQAYYRQYMDQRGQAGGTYAQQPAAGYTNQQAFNYGAYSRGERI